MARELFVLPIGQLPPGAAAGLAKRLEAHGFAAAVGRADGEAFHSLIPSNSSKVNAMFAIEALRREGGDSVLGLCALPLTDGRREWVYGLGEMNGRVSVFSIKPFRRGGLSLEEALNQLAPAVLHELAHNFGMVHCRRKGCLMHATHEPAAMRQLPQDFCEVCRPLWMSRLRRGVSARSPPPRGPRGAP